MGCFAIHAWQIYLLQGAMILFVMTGLALVPSMLQDTAPPAIRARVIDATTVVSLALGVTDPIIVGALSDSFGGTPSVLMWATVIVVSPGLGLSAVSYRSDEAVRRTTAALQSAQAT